MIAERVHQSHTNTKYYQFTTILEHVIDCFHTIVSDETNPYHPPLGWLTRKQIKPPDDELFSDLMDECSTICQQQPMKANQCYSMSGSSNSSQGSSNANNNTLCYVQNKSSQLNHNVHLSTSVKTRLERCSRDLRREITARTRDGCPPLFLACQNGLTNVVKYLLDICEADIEQKGRFETIEDQHVHLVPPIWVAAVSGHYDTVKLLIERGANVNSLSDTGSTPLRSVCFVCKDDDSFGSQISNNEPSGESAASSLHGDIFSIEQQSSDNNGNESNDDDGGRFMKIVRLLVENGADVTKPNYNGGTCLINSLYNYRLTKYILNQGADINATENNGKTALHYAILGNRLNVTKLLLAHGADPKLKTNFCDDALQLCCIGGSIEIFNHLIENYNYTSERLSDAYKLLGSSILELQGDIALVRSLWMESIKIKQQAYRAQIRQEDFDQTASSSSSSSSNDDSSSCQTNYCCDTDVLNSIQRRRALAFGRYTSEISTELELQQLSNDEFKIQSLLISERILGKTHRETIQRIRYRGAAYIDSMRPDRCVDMWIYALCLLLEQESIFNFETFIGARAMKKLFLDLICQQPQFVRFDDVYDVLDALVNHDRLEEYTRLLSIRPRSALQEDMFDLLLGIVVNLVLLANCTERDARDRAKIGQIISKLVSVNPKASDGSSLLHVCVTSSLLESEAYRALVQMSCSRRAKQAAPVLELIEQLLDSGLDVDQVNDNEMSALQMICLASSSIRGQEKWNIIRLLVERGAHIDRRTMCQEQQELIKLALRECGINQFGLLRLSCLAARQVSKQLGNVSRCATLTTEAMQLSGLSRGLRELVEMH